MSSYWVLVVHNTVESKLPEICKKMLRLVRLKNLDTKATTIFTHNVKVSSGTTRHIQAQPKSTFSLYGQQGQIDQSPPFRIVDGVSIEFCFDINRVGILLEGD
eukprot:scaffold871_cov130-Cylindrotheca_fusiformis.AAC.28